MSVPHPANAAGLGSAFVVEEVITPDRRLLRQTFGIEWWSSKTGWRTDDLPTRGEYLIRTPGPVRTRPVYALLRLRAPYLVEIAA